MAFDLDDDELEATRKLNGVGKKEMTNKEAINILIGLAVCIDPKLHCDDDCPFYKENGECKYVGKQFETSEAVKALKGER